MAHRRTPRAGVRAGRRKTQWVELRNELNSSLIAAGTRSEVVLMLPANESEAETLIRIVGSIFMGLQADVAGQRVELAAWGIYIAPSGSSGDLNLDPINAVDQDHENWMMLRQFYLSTAVVNLVPVPSEQKVDIRVSRKVEEGQGIKLVWNCTVAYVRAAALRGLVKQMH